MSRPAWRTTSSDLVNRRTSPSSAQIATEVTAPMPKWAVRSPPPDASTPKSERSNGSRRRSLKRRCGPGSAAARSSPTCGRNVLVLSAGRRLCGLRASGSSGAAGAATGRRLEDQGRTIASQRS
jgi:hypothetical protein